MYGYVIQEPPKSKGKGRYKKYQLVNTFRSTKKDCVMDWLGMNYITTWRKEWRKCYVIGWRVVKVKLIPTK